MSDQSKHHPQVGTAASAPDVDSPADIPPKGWKQILVAAWKDAGADNLSLVAAGVAFYAFLAFVPLLSALAMSYGLVAEPAMVVEHIQALSRLMPADAASIIAEQLRGLTETSSAKHGFGLLVALVISTYGASKGSSAVVTALNITYEVEETRGFIHRTLLSIGMTAAAIATLVLAIFAVSALHVLEAAAPDLSGASRLILKALFFLLAAGAVVLGLAALYRYGPNRPDAPWRWITPGSALATIVWLAASFGFGLYVANFGNYNATYGSLGAVVIFLTWLYLSAYVVLFGAELNSVLEIEVADRGPAANPAEPEPVARPAGEAERAQGSTLSLPALVARFGVFSILAGALGPKRRTA